MRALISRCEDAAPRKDLASPAGDDRQPFAPAAACDEHARWFDLELLPAYAPDLDPVEAVCTQRADLANLAADDLFAVGDAAGESLVVSIATFASDARTSRPFSC